MTGRRGSGEAHLDEDEDEDVLDDNDPRRWRLNVDGVVGR